MTKIIKKQEIDLNLDFGDYNMIARMANTTSAYVSQVLNDGRSRDSNTGKRIIHCAKALQQTKENLITLVRENEKEFSESKNYMIPVNRRLILKSK